MATTLADLRRESLAEQKSETTATSATPPAAESSSGASSSDSDASQADSIVPTDPTTPLPLTSDAQMRIQADAQMRTQASEYASTQVSTQGSTPLSMEVRTRGSTQVRPQVLEGARKTSSQDASARAREQLSAGIPLEEIVRSALAQKRQHPGGTKASVDMSPELSLRMKRYGLDHGGITSRQLFLELANAFLDREGY